MGRYDDPKYWVEDHPATEPKPARSRYDDPKFHRRDPTTLEVAGNASAKGVAGLLDSIGNTPTHLWNLGAAAIGTPLVALGKPEWAPGVLPTPDYARRALTAMGSIHPDAEPVTGWQRVLDQTVQGGVAGVLSPASGLRQIAGNAAVGGLSGLAGGVTEQGTGSQEAGMLASMLAPFGVAGATATGRRVAPNGEVSAGRKLLRVADDPAAMRAALVRPAVIVPGSLPTTAEAVMQSGISQAQRNAISMGYGPLTERAAQQNLARVAQLERVAPGATRITPVEAAENAGNVVFRLADDARGRYKAARNAAYHAPELNSASLMLPTGGQARAAIETFYPGASFDVAPADLRRMVALMDEGGHAPLREFDALRKQAGNRAADLADTDRTAAAAWSKIRGLFDDAEQSAVARSGEKFAVTGQGPWGPEFGNLAGDPENAVAHLLRMGRGSVPNAAENPFAGQTQLVAGPANQTGRAPFGLVRVEQQGRPDELRAIPGLLREGSWYSRLQKSKNGLQPKSGEPDWTYLGDGKMEAFMRPDFDGSPTQRWPHSVYSVREDRRLPIEIDYSSRGADFTHSPQTPNATMGASSIDDALSGLLSDAAAARNPHPPAPPPRDPRQYVGGLLAPDQADALALGRELHGEMMRRYHEGAARDLFRDGADRVRVATGGEIPKVFFRPSADQAERMESFSGMYPGIRDAAPAYDAMRKYAIADLYGRAAGETGTLRPMTFGNWIDARGGLEGGGAIGGLFTPEQRTALGDVRADLRRSTEARDLGRVSGSDTAQKLFTSGGLLDSRAADFLAGRLGGFGRGGLAMLRDAARKDAMDRLGPLLLDPASARAAIEAADRHTLRGLLADRLPRAADRSVMQGLLYLDNEE